MKINWNIEHLEKLPYSVLSYIYSDINRMRHNIKKNKKCFIHVCLHTKMSLDITMRYDEDAFCVAYIPAGAEKFKFVENTQYSFFDNGRHTSHYFRFSKKQNLKHLKEYLELVIAEMKLDVDELEVCMTIRGIEGLKE